MSDAACGPNSSPFTNACRADGAGEGDGDERDVAHELVEVLATLRRNDGDEPALRVAADAKPLAAVVGDGVLEKRDELVGGVADVAAPVVREAREARGHLRVR